MPDRQWTTRVMGRATVRKADGIKFIEEDDARCVPVGEPKDYYVKSNGSMR